MDKEIQAIIVAALDAALSTTTARQNFNAIMRKHVGVDAAGSRLLTSFESAEALVEMLKGMEWQMSARTSTLLVAEAKLPEWCPAEMAACNLLVLPDDREVWMDPTSVGTGHPTLLTVDAPDPVDFITVVVELAGDEYEADAKAFGFAHGEPLLATFYPGPDLGRSEPGVETRTPSGVMTAAEAYKLGWRVVNFA